MNAAQVSADGGHAPDVSRETSPITGQQDGWTNDVADTPIGAAAERAMHVPTPFTRSFHARRAAGS